MLHRIAALALAGSLLAGCYAGPRTAHTVGRVATAAIWSAAIAGQLVALSSHDPHVHHERCGHYRRWHQGRWVYYYQGHWEYYDDGRGRWYYYAD